MKKLVCVLLALVCVFGIMGCGKPENNETVTNDIYSAPFTEVMSVSYTAKNSTEQIYSEIHLTFDEPIEITKEEFYAFDEYYQSDNPHYINDKNILRDKSNIDKWKAGQFIVLKNFGYDYEDLYQGYHKLKIQNTELRYVSVKLVDNRALFIKTFDGNVTFLSVDSYAVEYFK